MPLEQGCGFTGALFQTRQHGPFEDYSADDTDSKHQIIQRVERPTEYRHAEVLQCLGEGTDPKDKSTPDDPRSKRSMTRDAQDQVHNEWNQNVDQIARDEGPQWPTILRAGEEVKYPDSDRHANDQ